MKYLALGDSISIDDYTGVAGGGAASQFARLLAANDFWDYTRDGCTTAGVLSALHGVPGQPDIVTLTAGGNDFLQGAFALFSRTDVQPADWLAIADAPLANLERIAEKLATYRCPVIINTVYDPTDGDSAFSTELGLRPEARPAFHRLNDGIRDIAACSGFLLSDLEILFRGHGVNAQDTWYTLGIEPNLAGATATARHWHELYRNRP